jgi:hypothetical protein
MGVLAPALLLVMLMTGWASSSSSASAGAGGSPGAAGAAGAAGATGSPGAGGAGGEAGSPGTAGADGAGADGAGADGASAAGADGSASVIMVSCSGTTCSVTLAGNGSRVQVFDTTISLVRVDNGQATLRAGDQEISCTQGQSISAGSLMLECTTVTHDTVTFTASRG